MMGFISIKSTLLKLSVVFLILNAHATWGDSNVLLKTDKMQPIYEQPNLELQLQNGPIAGLSSSQDVPNRFPSKPSSFAAPSQGSMTPQTSFRPGFARRPSNQVNANTGFDRFNQGTPSGGSLDFSTSGAPSNMMQLFKLMSGNQGGASPGIGDSMTLGSPSPSLSQAQMGSPMESFGSPMMSGFGMGFGGMSPGMRPGRRGSRMFYL